MYLYQSKNSQDITIYINAQLSITNELKDNLSCSLGLINHENSYTILGVRISLLKLCGEDQILGILFLFQGTPLATAHCGKKIGEIRIIRRTGICLYPIMNFLLVKVNYSKDGISSYSQEAKVLNQTFPMCNDG